ncbi:MAG: hypothetical protein B7X95_05080 [Methylophilaceae bacterium 17-44-8]|nr:MAG: hypothetical protein B7X95_05080 [Methylophilaceae bacterium 17-44-8]
MAKFKVISNGFTKSFQLPAFTKINFATVNGLAVDVQDVGNNAVLETAGNNGQLIVIDYQEEGVNVATKSRKLRGMIEQYAMGAGAFGGTGWINSAGANTTFQLFLATRGKPYAMRVVYSNPFTTPYTIDNTTVFASPIEPQPTGNGDSINPTGATAIPVTFGGVADAVVPAATVLGTNVFLASDWITVNPVERTDFPNTFYEFAIRSFASANIAMDTTRFPNQYPLNLGNLSGNTQANLTRWAQNVTGNVTATPTGFTRGQNSGFHCAMHLEFAVAAKVLKVVSVGDSLTAGAAAGATSIDGAGSQFYSFVERAVNTVNNQIATESYYLSHMNMGTGGQTVNGATQSFYSRLPNLLAIAKPDVVVISAWSPNSPPTTQATYDSQVAKVLLGIQQIIEAGAIPLLWTSPPAGVISSAAEVYRLQTNTMLRNLASNGSIVLTDLDPLLTNGATPVANFKTGLSHDSVHPNSTAQGLMADELAKSLRNISLE